MDNSNPTLPYLRIAFSPVPLTKIFICLLRLACAILNNMETTSKLRASWPAWAEFLRRRGLTHLIVWALEAAGPLSVLGAQAVYFGRPLLQPWLSTESQDMLAHLLEDEQERRAFLSYLHSQEAKL